jgi:hypothetical protein
MHPNQDYASQGSLPGQTSGCEASGLVLTYSLNHASFEKDQSNSKAAGQGVTGLEKLGIAATKTIVWVCLAFAIVLCSEQIEI